MAKTASVIIPTRGGKTRLPRLVQAFADQSNKNYEPIFVIDGDIDGSGEYLRSGRVKKLLPNSMVIQFPENRGRAVALNEGHEVAKGDVLIRCDDDLAPKPSFIESHLTAHSKELRGVIGLTTNVYPETPFAVSYGKDADSRFISDALQTDPSKIWRYWAANVSIPREIWDEVGHYDPSYRRYGWEDVDYGYRIHKAGFPIVIEPSLLTDHHAGATTTTSRALRALHSGASREIFISHHGADSLGTAHFKGAWSRLVDIAALVGTEKNVALASTFVDRVLPFVPQPIGRKFVALMVEGAGRSGVRFPKRAKAHF